MLFCFFKKNCSNNAFFHLFIVDVPLHLRQRVRRVRGAVDLGRPPQRQRLIPPMVLLGPQDGSLPRDGHDRDRPVSEDGLVVACRGHLAAEEARGGPGHARQANVGQVAVGLLKLKVLDE